MTDQIKQKVDTFLNFMKLPDGAPIVPLKMVDWLISKGFFHAPASTKYHGNHEGGLLEHSYMVAKALIDMSEREGVGMEQSTLSVGRGYVPRPLQDRPVSPPCYR